jgi:hypothetical protein
MPKDRPTIKDDDRYEAMREEGFNHEIGGASRLKRRIIERALYLTLGLMVILALVSWLLVSRPVLNRFDYV